MKYELLVLDLDGTLTNSRKEVSQYTLRVLKEAQQRGAKVALASGRPAYGITPLAELLELERYGGFVLAYNGGEIIDWRSKELLYANVLDSSVVPYMYRCAKENNFAIVTYRGKYVLTETPDDEYVLKEAILNVMETKKVEHFLKAVDFPLPKCLIVGDADRLALLEPVMREHLKESNEVYRSEPYFLELVPKGIDKARSLAVLSGIIGIPAEKMIACGDGFNDLSMIQYAGLGVAMSNAQPIIKQHADYITCSNDEDGVARVIEKFILSEE